MIDQARPLLLGSASPRRREILEGLRIPISVCPADIVEDVLPGEAPQDYLARIVREKLGAVAARAAGLAYGALLVADTSVVLGREILGKPADVADAERLLASLSGRTHIVYTRYAIARAEAPSVPVAERTVESEVTMRAASAEELRRYAATGEGLDKAGAYAVQGIGSFLVESIQGSYSNVVGLPACEVVRDLLELGVLSQFP
ncbi:MAG TPA: nucleoside triphosphate pyrophosphatase [Polyangiaceae bacterium]|nr:nucleoside triphosphate pyrophosphatase [Polyangiaceae bacterium]